MNLEKVMAIEHYTDDLFWFRTTKSDAGIINEGFA